MRLFLNPSCFGQVPCLPLIYFPLYLSVCPSLQEFCALLGPILLGVYGADLIFFSWKQLGSALLLPALRGDAGQVYLFVWSMVAVKEPSKESSTKP